MWQAAFARPARRLPLAKVKSFADNRRRISMSLFPVAVGSGDSALEIFRIGECSPQICCLPYFHEKMN
jgi:hypothetical protein